MEPKPIALSVLMTREEYMQLTVQIHRLRSGGPSFFYPGGRYSGDLVPGRYLLWPLYFAVPFYRGMSAGVRCVFDDL